MTGFPKHKRWKSKKWREGASNQDCKMSLPGCRNDTSTVVLAHRNGAGMALKADDHDGADSCRGCHDVLDGLRRVPGWSMEQVMEEFERARLETIINRLERGVLK